MVVFEQFSSPRRFEFFPAPRRLMRAAALSLALAGVAAAPAPALAGGIKLPATDVGSLLLADAMDAADKKKWSEAAAVAGRAPDPLARTLVEWRQLVRTGGDWASLSDFLSAHPGWPYESRIRARAERAMPANMSARAVLDFFGDRSPISGRGAMMKARALTETGRSDEARALVRKAWAETPMGKTEREDFVKRHGALIGDLHKSRADEMAWRGREDDARAAAAFLDSGQQRLIDARVALTAREKGVDGKVKAVPSSLIGDPGLAWARFDWRMWKGLRDTAQTLLRERSASADKLGRPQSWAGGRARLARSAFRAGQYREAYALASQHRLTRGVSFADMEWFAGWVALNKLSDAGTAATRFETLYNGVSSPISRGRGAYWTARAAEKQGNGAKAAEWRRLAASHDETYYGQLAALELGGTAAAKAADSGPRKASQATREDERLRAALALSIAGRANLGRGFIGALASDLGPSELSALSLQMLDEDQPHYALLLAKAARRAGQAPAESLFPVIDLPTLSGGVEKSLALAIMRQESEFNPQAVSRVGARGLMQLMPDTAKRTAPRAGLGYDKARLLSDWKYNAALGRTYLSEMLAEFGGSAPLAVAAYNAGPHRVTEWIRRFGDPRRNQINVIDWVETIPFAETRNYVQRVLEARAVYERRLNGTPVEKSLARDLFGGRG